MPQSIWIHMIDSDPPRPGLESLLAVLRSALHDAGLELVEMPPEPAGLGLWVLSCVDDAALDHIRLASRHATVWALAPAPARMLQRELWALLRAGADDVLPWPTQRSEAKALCARLQRAAQLQRVLHSPRVAGELIGHSSAWRRLLRDAVEMALYSRNPLLITGETGTGKELVAHLVHDVDPRPAKGELVIVDCTTLTPELAGSELFGHERGAYTGALAPREGAVARADGGTLFLDEVGELPPPLQAQLLRVVQEGRYKRIGSNTWQSATFRLLAATHRDLQADVAAGRFRADLYHRLAGAVCRTPPLRERREDVLALALHVQAGFEPALGDEQPSGFDEPVCRYLQARDYPGNVRELRRVVLRMCQRHAGGGPVTLGDVPEDERPDEDAPSQVRLHAGLEAAVAEAITLGMGLKDIGLAATECAIRLAIEREGGNLHRAAARLGVTGRALQLRRAQQRPGA